MDLRIFEKIFADFLGFLAGCTRTFWSDRPTPPLRLAPSLFRDISALRNIVTSAGA